MTSLTLAHLIPALDMTMTWTDAPIAAEMITTGAPTMTGTTAETIAETTAGITAGTTAGTTIGTIIGLHHDAITATTITTTTIMTARAAPGQGLGPALTFLAPTRLRPTMAVPLETGFAALRALEEEPKSSLRLPTVASGSLETARNVLEMCADVCSEWIQRAIILPNSRRGKGYPQYACNIRSWLPTGGHADASHRRRHYSMAGGIEITVEIKKSFSE